MSSRQKNKPEQKSDFILSAEQTIQDYRTAYRSRIASLIGRKEVLTGKASFGIFGDGIEVPQIALAKAFEKGDLRSGYYRDQTILFATNMATIDEFFSQLYADPHLENEPHSRGRQMNNHFATRMLDEKGNFKNLTSLPQSASDVSPTAAQMPRLLGLAYASKMYRLEKSLKDWDDSFSVNGNEIVFGSIGDASTSEGLFFETMNAAAVLQVPLLMSVWDNGFGISVPRHLQTVNDSISHALKGFSSPEAHQGIDIYVVKAWDYVGLCSTYLSAAKKIRHSHK
ncbi:MAG: hypothetical protein K2X39_01935, partial [Silvanigrellaceae bacterium]|nr:hypothetical protein [Silvanigrellaceae bacterium]